MSLVLFLLAIFLIPQLLFALLLVWQRRLDAQTKEKFESARALRAQTKEEILKNEVSS